MECHIISIGNELLIGDTVNTNASWLGQRLTESGVDVTQVHTIRDELNTMKSVLQTALQQADLVITTGGLGPTHDDITKKAIAELLGCELVVDQDILSFIKNIFEKRGIPFSKSNYHQAEVPECCEVLFNTQGTAPGLWYNGEQAALGVLPGVPFEMKHLTNNKLLPKINSISGDRRYRFSHYLTTAGIGESTLSDEVIGDLSSLLNDNVEVAYLPSPQGARIRVSGYGRSQDKINERLNPVLDHIRDKAGTFIIGEGKDCSLSAEVGKVLQNQKLTMAAAESCTGGYIANAVTDIPGSSDYFVGSVTAYANAVKIKELGVSKEVIETNGAVSKEVALKMAKGAAQELNADIGISTTGIAGPGGGSKEKPVGTIWIGFWAQNQHFALQALFTNKRLINKERSAAVALETIRRSILDISEMPYGLKKHSA
ncbi:competence/damage-inducible protein cinA [Fodinibius salinus]|uniref:CinA-like protein n=1 Tax=Fodinibius salinus TaxID=860790 RepID=A0A5D3YN27_9BACT|nr:competence/damage-inducible protein A [Fodinibius salinus]TYP95264.1 competence/damage-inducible protein cinA [Fodinibius salinus]